MMNKILKVAIILGIVLYSAGLMIIPAGIISEKAIKVIDEKNVKIKAVEDNYWQVWNNYENAKEYSRRLNISIDVRNEEIEVLRKELSKKNKSNNAFNKLKKVYKQPVEPKELTFSEQIQKVLPHVVHIINETQEWQGSGVAISEDIILTARHFLENGDDFTVTDSKGNKIKAYKAISNKNYDIGFLKVVDPNLSPCELASTKDLKLGQDLFVIGSPYGKVNFNSVTKGIVSGIDREFDFTDWNDEEYGWSVAFTTDSAGHPGNSGCPIFTMDGKVRGILVGGFSPVLTIAMPVDIILEDIEEIEILFAQIEYYLEEKPEYEYNSYYNNKEGNEYY